MSQSPPRKLTARRGSVSAPDPLGKNASLNCDPNRSSSSTLTIVRVVDPATPSGVVLGSPDSPSSPALSRRSLRRHGSTSASSSTDIRLSFAFTSFSPVSSSQPTSPLSTSFSHNNPSRNGSSPSSSPRLRPSSPQFVRRNSASGGSTFSKPHLTPEQLVDLARQSSTPRYVPSTAPSNQNSVDPTAPPISSPAKFTVLPVDVYLPFVDRAAETTHLLSTPPTKKLLSLLAQTFPAQVQHEVQDPFTVDPDRWTFNTLLRWLTEVDRSSAKDALWVRRARKCVLSHSELIWERLKGALGVPPELELEDADTDSRIAFTLSSTGDGDGPEEIDCSQLDQTTLTSSEQSLTIEPILATSASLAPSTPGVSNPPPSSLPASLSQSTCVSQVDQVLQDIVEDREEEEESGADPCGDDRLKSEDEAQIHGIRVCTSPVPSVAPHVFSHPSSPDIMSGRNSVEPRSPDFCPSPIARRLSRTGSHGSVASVGRPISGSFAYRDFGFSTTSSEIGESESERAYDLVGDRVPGNPLFPSNFARLVFGPTSHTSNYVPP